MEGIPSKARNLQMNLLLGKLYRYARHNRAAIAYYKECLRLVSESIKTSMVTILFSLLTSVFVN